MNISGNKVLLPEKTTIWFYRDNSKKKKPLFFPYLFIPLNKFYEVFFSLS